jgi:predicted nucleic acid-binding Zn ribbon protein
MRPSLGLAIGIVGVAIILAPVTLYILTGYGSPVQRMLDMQLVPGLPFGLILSSAGAAVSAVGVVLFIKAIRTVGSAPPLAVYNRTARQVRSSPKPELETLEAEIEKILDNDRVESPRVEVRTPQPPRRAAQAVTVDQPPTPERQKPQKEKTANIEVISHGFDMVCKSCGALNPLDSKVCKECGGKIYEPNPRLPACPVCGAPLESDQRIGERLVCTVCFSELLVKR